MADEQEKTVAPQEAPIIKDRLGTKVPQAAEARRLQEMLEDDEVRECLKELHSNKSRSG